MSITWQCSPTEAWNKVSDTEEAELRKGGVTLVHWAAANFFSFSLPHVTNYNSCFTATLKGHTTLECSLAITRSWCLWWPSQCYYSQGSSDGRWHQSSAQYSQIATFSFWFGLISVCSVAPLANRNPCFICDRKKWLLSVLIRIAFSNRILKRAVMFPCLVYWPRDTRFQMC